MDKNFKLIRGKREFNLDYYVVASFYNSRIEKPAVDEIMRQNVHENLSISIGWKILKNRIKISKKLDFLSFFRV